MNGEPLMLMSRGVARPLPLSPSSNTASSPWTKELLLRLVVLKLWLNEDRSLFRIPIEALPAPSPASYSWDEGTRDPSQELPGATSALLAL